MNLYIDPIDKVYSPFSAFQDDEAIHSLPSFSEPAVTYRISVAPLRKHSLDDCPVFEKQWRDCAPTVMSAIMGQEFVSIVWATGPLETDGLLQVMRQVDLWNKLGIPYQFPPVSSLDRRKGYHVSWIAFEFDIQAFRELNQDLSVDFEYVPLSLLFFSEEEFEAVIKSRFEPICVELVEKKNAIGLVHERHYEGCFIIGDPRVIDPALERVRMLT